MKPKHLITIAFFSLLIGLPVGLFINATAQNPSTTGQEPQRSSSYRLSGPYTHGKLDGVSGPWERPHQQDLSHSSGSSRAKEGAEFMKPKT